MCAEVGTINNLREGKTKKGQPRATEGWAFEVLGGRMELILLQFAVFVGVAVYLVRWKANVRRRNAQTWESLVARLRPDLNARVLGDGAVWKNVVNAAPEEQWRRIQGAAGLWTMYENARVMLEMADYAARNSDLVDRELLETLRSDAMQIRICVLTALVKYAFCQVNESICVNAFRAASAYQEMAVRMGELLQGNGMVAAPSFGAAI